MNHILENSLIVCVPHTVIMRQEAPWTHLGEDILVKFQPGLVALAVRVLQPEEPDLPQPDCLHNLRKGAKDTLVASSDVYLPLSPSSNRHYGNVWKMK